MASPPTPTARIEGPASDLVLFLDPVADSDLLPPPARVEGPSSDSELFLDPDRDSDLVPTAHRPASDEVSVVLCPGIDTNLRRPRAVVVLLGWAGCTHYNLERYASLYHSRGCSTVSTAAPEWALAEGPGGGVGPGLRAKTKAKKALEAVAITVLREVAMVVKRGEMSEMGYGPVPIIVHAFSNGGACVVQMMESVLREVVGDADETIERLLSGSTCAPSALMPPSMASKMRSMKGFNTSQRDLMACVRDDLKHRKGHRSKRKGKKMYRSEAFNVSALASPSNDCIECIPIGPPLSFNSAYDNNKTYASPATQRALAAESETLFSTPPSFDGSEVSFTTAPETIISTDDCGEEVEVQLTPLPSRKTAGCSHTLAAVSRALRLHAVSGSNDRRKRRKRGGGHGKNRPKVKRTDSSWSNLRDDGDKNDSAFVVNASPPSYNTEERAYNLDLAIVAARLRSNGCIIYDSGPCYPTVAAAKSSRQGGKTTIRQRCAAACARYRRRCLTMQPEARRCCPWEELWRSMERSQLSRREAYVYSASDPVVDCTKLEELIELRRERNRHRVRMGKIGYQGEGEGDGDKAAGVTVLRFEDSNHVSHLRAHGDEYESFLDVQLRALVPEIDPEEGAWSDEDEDVNESDEYF